MGTITLQLRSALLLGAVFSGLTSAGGVALAQTDDAAAAAQQTGAVETLVVTARKRAESIQKTPVAVTAVDADQIDKLFVQNLAELTRVAPNFTIEGVGAINRNSGVIYSRGIGYSGVDQGQDPAVGVSVNGIFWGRSIGALANMFDVEQVEILRGPQGTLFGKNTIGGVVNITTRKPGDIYSFDGSLRYGNLGRIDYMAGADIPLDETLAVRIAYQSQYSDGAFTNAFTGPLAPKKLGGDDIQTIRGTVVWTPTPELSFELMGSYLRDRSASVGGQNGSGPTDLVFFAFGQPGFGFPGGQTDPYTVTRNFPSSDHQDTVLASLDARYRGDGFDIVSVTGFVRDSNNSFNDYDSTPLTVIESYFPRHNKQFSEELRVESTGDSRLSWVAGAMYTTRTWDAEQELFVDALLPPALIALAHQIDYAKQHDDAWALFGQASYEVVDNLELTFGMRYTNQEKDMYRIAQHPVIFPAPAAIYRKTSWSNTTYHAGARYQFDDDLMAYATFSTGFIVGGWNSRSNTAAAIGPYEPTTADAWEVGVKSDWYDRRLRLNISAFWNQYDDLQVGVFIGGAQQVIANNAFERARGVEIEATAVPMERLLLSASIGYLDASYTSFMADLDASGIITDNSGLRPVRAPMWTMRLQGSYEIPLGEHGSLTPDVSYAYEGSHYTDTRNAPQGLQKGYSIWNASLNYAEPDKRWEVSLWGRNLTDELHILSAIPTSGLFTQLYFANPRTYGLELRVKLQADE